MADDFGNEVGYRKPPKISQFQKGRSGNPSGRPRKNPSIADMFRKVIKQVVVTNGTNGKRRMTKLEASITQLMNKATAGDLKAMKLALQMLSRFPELVKGPEAPVTIVIKDPVSPTKSEEGTQF